MKVVTVDHGKPFGNYKWYTFYCPECKAQVTRDKIEGNKCKECQIDIEWPD